MSDLERLRCQLVGGRGGHVVGSTRPTHAAFDGHALHVRQPVASNTLRPHPAGPGLGDAPLPSQSLPLGQAQPRSMQRLVAHVGAAGHVEALLGASVAGEHIARVRRCLGAWVEMRDPAPLAAVSASHTCDAGSL